MAKFCDVCTIEDMRDGRGTINLRLSESCPNHGEAVKAMKLHYQATGRITPLMLALAESVQAAREARNRQRQPAVEPFDATNPGQSSTKDPVDIASPVRTTFTYYDTEGNEKHGTRTVVPNVPNEAE
jgi:hypothetical protein